MVKELISRIFLVIGSIVIIYMVVSIALSINVVEKGKIVTDNTWANFNDNNDVSVDINKLKTDKNNNDIYGVLRIDSVELYTILTKTNDNEYYLSHDLNNKKKEYGNPFVDYRTKGLDDEIIVIYSKTSNEDMTKLYKLFNRDEFNKENPIYLYIGDTNSEYELLSIKMSNQLLVNTDVIKESYTEYNDSTDVIENKKVSDNKTEDDNIDIEDVELDEDLDSDKEEKKEATVTDILLGDNKYCKSDCSIGLNDKLLVIELRNDETSISNVLIVAKRVTE